MRERKGIGIRVLAVLVLVTAILAAWQASRPEKGGFEPADRTLLDAASGSLTAALSYDHRTLEEDLGAAQGGMTTDFAADFGETFARTAGILAAKNKAVVKANVAAAGLVSRDGDDAVVLAFVDQVRRDDKNDRPQIVSSRVSVELRQVGGRWLIQDIRPF